MTTSGSNRREIMIATLGAGVAALLPSAAAQQTPQDESVPIIAQMAGQTHERAVSRLREVLGGDAPNTRAGLHKLVEFLRKSRLIDDTDAKLLHGMVDALYEAADVDKLEKEIFEMLERAKANAKDLTITIVSVALSSIRSVRKEFSDHKRAIFVVCGDVSGALLGAGGCWALGPWLAVPAALSTAIAGSCTAWYASR